MCIIESGTYCLEHRDVLFGFKISTSTKPLASKGNTLQISTNLSSWSASLMVAASHRLQTTNLLLCVAFSLCADACDQTSLQQLLLRVACCTSNRTVEGFQYMSTHRFSPAPKLFVTASSTRQCHRQLGSCLAKFVYHAVAVD